MIHVELKEDRRGDREGEFKIDLRGSTRTWLRLDINPRSSLFRCEESLCARKCIVQGKLMLLDGSSQQMREPQEFQSNQEIWGDMT
jgi:hypothetical protein